MDLVLVEEGGRIERITGLMRWREGRLFLFQGANFPEVPIPDGMLKHIRSTAAELRGRAGSSDCVLVVRERAFISLGQLAEPEALAAG